MRNYEVLITGDHTSGSFELHAAAEDGSPVWSTGPLRVALTANELQFKLANIPFFADNALVSMTDTSEKMAGPKSWLVKVNGALWAPRHGNSGLTGMCSPNVTVMWKGWTPQ